MTDDKTPDWMTPEYRKARMTQSTIGGPNGHFWDEWNQPMTLEQATGRAPPPPPPADGKVRPLFPEYEQKKL